MSYDLDEWRQPWRDDASTATVATTRAATGLLVASSSSTGPAPATALAEPAVPTAGGRFLDPPAPLLFGGVTIPAPPSGGVAPPPVAPPPVAPAAAQAPARRLGVAWLLVAALLAGLIGSAATLAVVAPRLRAVTAQPDPPPAPSVPIEVPDTVGLIPAVARAVTPSVVRIDVRPGTDEGSVPLRGSSQGSGVVYRADGYILTNHHVVESALLPGGSVNVRLANGDIVVAQIVGVDELNDLAVVRIDRRDLPPVALRPADEQLAVGETVVAIGSPFGLDASVTAGIISALDREIRVDETIVIPSVIQTDAAINPGNSGGALVDVQGRLVGINTAILSRTGVNQGVGFAVSYGQAIASADQLIAQGFVRHPLLGVSGMDVTPEIAQRHGLDSSRGAVVESVQPDSAASQAGVREGDIIVEVDGAVLATMAQLVAEVRSRAVGDEIELGILRDGRRLEVVVTLGERPR